MPDIYINTDRPIDRSIVAGINQPQREAPIGAFVAGSSYDTNLYFVRNDGTYNALSGDAGASVQVSISTLGKPQSGTFTLTDGVDTTSAIEYGASALDVQTALNALNGGAGLDLSNNYPITISGAGESAVNGDYFISGTTDGKPRYENSADSNQIIFWSSGLSSWYVGSTLSGQPAYISSNDVSSPDLITVWDTAQGAFPLPTIEKVNSQVIVEKVSNEQYVVTFETLGTADALGGTNVSLYPESTPTASIAVAGDATTKAQQIIEITRQPAVYQATWSTITNGFNATLALNTTRLLQSLLIDKDMPFYIEVKLNSEVVAREVVGMELSTMPASAFSATGLATLLDTFAASPASNATFSPSTWRSALDINIYGQLYFSATSETAIATPGTYVKLAGTTTSDSLSGITMPLNNRLQNSSGATRVFQVSAKTDISDGSGNKTVSIKLSKNGTLIDATESDGETTNNVGAHSSIIWFVSLANGDYIEIWTTNKTDTSSLTAQHGHLSLKAIN